MWKRESWLSGNYSAASESRIYTSERPTQPGNVIAVVGNVKDNSVSKDAGKEHLERLERIDDEILGYNLDGRLALMRCKKNDRKFDIYIAMSFTKGVTERKTGRTMLILGSDAHHIESMQGQFSGVVWLKNDIDKVKKYGDTVRWINVGDTLEGFIGLDYNPSASEDAGVATSIDDVSFLASTLIEYGYNPEKKLFLLKPPYIAESEAGKSMRARGCSTLKDYKLLKFK